MHQKQHDRHRKQQNWYQKQQNRYQKQQSWQQKHQNWYQHDMDLVTGSIPHTCGVAVLEDLCVVVIRGQAVAVLVDVPRRVVFVAAAVVELRSCEAWRLFREVAAVDEVAVVGEAEDGPAVGPRRASRETSCTDRGGCDEVLV